MTVQVKGGPTAARLAYTPPSRELVVDTTTKKLFLGDGSTAGGLALDNSESTLGIFNIMDYGGTADGATDNLAAYGDALTAAKGTYNGRIYFPAGDYVMSDLIELDAAGLAIIGDGPASNIIGPTGADAVTLDISAADCSVRNMGFTGGRNAQTDGANECIRLLSGAVRSNIVHNLFTGVSTSAGYNVQIRGESGCIDPFIAFNRFERVFGTSSGYGYGIQLASVVGGIIGANISRQSATQGRHHIYLSAACNGVGVVNNRLYDGTSAMITLYSTTTSIEDVNIDSNMLQAGGTGGGTGGAIEMVGKVAECGAANNIVRDAAAFGFKLEGDGSGNQYCNSNVLDGNKVFDSGDSGYTLKGASQIDVLGGLVKNAGGDGIEMASVNGTGTDTTDGCNIKGVNVAGTGHAYAISFSGEDVVSSGCTLTAGSSGTYSGIDPTKRKVSNFDDYGPQRIFSNSSPDSVVTLPRGSTCQDRSTGTLYINTDGATAWSEV